MTKFEDIEQLLRIAARQHFWAFCCYFDFEFFSVNRPFLKDVAISMQSVIDEYEKGNAIKISVSMPPRAGKSYITSLFAAYWLCRFPTLSVMRNTCTSTLYDKFSYDTRAIFRGTKIKEVFPEIELSPDKQNVGGWNLTTAKQVSYFGAGVGGSIIGFGANLAITDDLYKSMNDALSSTVQQTTKSWKQSAHDSRKEKNCPEIYIGTRWTKSDIIGEAMESGDLYSSVVIPALTVDGNSFCENVKSTAEYLKIKESISTIIWNAEYMQSPIELEGLLLPKSSLTFDDLTQLKDEDAVFRFAVGDPADMGGDKFSIPFMYVLSADDKLLCCVKSVIFNTDGIVANTNRIIQRCSDSNINHIWIETNGVGLSAFHQLKAKTNTIKINGINSSTNKEVRILSNFEFIRDNFAFCSVQYETNSEYKAFVNDLTNYVKGAENKHAKDAIDSLCTAAIILQSKFKSVLNKL